MSRKERGFTAVPLSLEEDNKKPRVFASLIVDPGGNTIELCLSSEPDDTGYSILYIDGRDGKLYLYEDSSLEDLGLAMTSRGTIQIAK